MTLVDSHCHLDRLETAPGALDELLAHAEMQGVGYMLCVCIDIETFPNVLALAHQHPHIFASVGLHPNETSGVEPDTQRLVELAKDTKVIAIGETGLDYFRSDGDLDWQCERFRRHISASRITGKPLIIHSREAKEDTLSILKEEAADEIGGVMHCFTEDWETAQRAMDLNFYISFSGIVTFGNATLLKEVATRMPLERLLIETDSPYLAPVPHRGKSNQPAYVRHVAEYIAGLRGVSLEAIAEASTANFFTLFKHATSH